MKYVILFIIIILSVKINAQDTNNKPGTKSDNEEYGFKFHSKYYKKRKNPYINRTEPQKNTKDGKEISKSMTTIGSGFPLSSDKIRSYESIGAEIIIYSLLDEGLVKSGFSIGGGIIPLPEEMFYLSFAFSGMLSLINPDWGPFLRIDLGISGIPFTDDTDLSELFLGVFFKSGGGFLIGNSEIGLSLQLLAAGMVSTQGMNYGFEVQIGTHLSF